MNKILITIGLILALTMPVKAVEIEAPQVPDSGEALMPAETENFGQGLWKVIKNGIAATSPELRSGAGACVCLIAIAMLASLLRSMPGNTQQIIELAGVVALCTVFLRTVGSMISLGADTVTELSQYGKLLIPIMTAALAAQGGVTASASLYTGTTVFDAVLSSAVSNLMIPLVYVYLVLAIGANTTGEETLKKLKGFVKWLVTWCLKTALYIFTGYISITGVVSGSADAATLKATKLTISGMVPVVGGILSDASEAVIVGAQVVKNAAGIYGMLAVIAVWIAPFLRLGALCLLLKLTAAVCDCFCVKRISAMIQDFSTAMGLLLGMTGSVCVMLLVSTVCFMRGVG